MELRPSSFSVSRSPSKKYFSLLMKTKVDFRDHKIRIIIISSSSIIIISSSSSSIVVYSTSKYCSCLLHIAGIPVLPCNF
jgi:hypothetical protein